jgi:ketosteroid isomerase-like protein
MLRRQMLNTLAGLAATHTAASHSAPQPPSAADMVIEIDRRLNRSILAHDVASAAALYDDDFLLTVSGGGFKRKADMLADIGNPTVALSVCETTDVHVRIRGSTAVLTGTLLQAGTVNGRAFDVKLHVTDTWVNVDGRWLLLAGHASLAK